jgi:cytochrome c-type biogenesis protein CcmH
LRPAGIARATVRHPDPDGTMGLWFPLAMMTAAAIFVVLWPLGRSCSMSTSGGELAVYRDQMGELNRDRAAGLIGRAEAEAARVEIARRLLAAAAVEYAPPMIARPWRRRFVALVAGIALPIAAIGLYLSLGTPGLPDQPLAARTDAPLQKRLFAAPSAGTVTNVVGMGDRP